MTPARGLAEADGVTGCRVLRTAGADYADGAEEIVHSILRFAVDRSALSDELHHAACTWPERYHLDRGRANLLRALRLPATARVLEVGCGCGAVTRYLAETVALVDAVEPMAARAAAARARTADLGNVEVFVGLIEDVPAEPVYDVVVAVGVLEYVADGSPQDAPYVAFLDAVRRRLAPGGVAVLATENQFGVKYLAGAPEDHTGRAWDGVHGYPHGGHAHTFGRRGLQRQFAAAGFGSTRMLGLFPDHRMTRLVLDDTLADAQPRLATALPVMPSPDHVGDAARVADEGRIWAELVRGGSPGEHWNSFLVLAGEDEAATRRLWPDGRHAVYFNTDRASALCGRAEVVTDGTTWSVRRSAMATGDAGAVRLRDYAEPVLDLPTLLDVVTEHPERAVDLLEEWKHLVHLTWPQHRGAAWDLVPHNVLVGDDGLVPIDLEWEVDGLTAEDVVARGLLLTADSLAARGWAGAGEDTTVGGLAAWLAVACGLDPAVVTAAAEKEAWFQAVRVTGSTADPMLDEETANMSGAMRRRLDEPVYGKGAGG